MTSGFLGDASVLSGSIGSGQVASGHMASGFIFFLTTSATLTSGQVTSGLIGDAAVVSGSIASGAISQFKLASGAVNSGQVGSGSIVGAVGAGRSIASGTIAHPDFGSGAIQSGDIASGQVGQFHLASGIITTIPTGRTLWVDGTNGNDTTGRRGFENLPFLTISGAIVAAASGDLISLRPNIYPEAIVLKDGLALRGQDQQSCVIAGTGASGEYVVLVSGSVAVSVSEVTITSTPASGAITTAVELGGTITNTQFRRCLINGDTSNVGSTVTGVEDFTGGGGSPATVPPLLKDCSVSLIKATSGSIGVSKIGASQATFENVLVGLDSNANTNAIGVSVIAGTAGLWLLRVRSECALLGTALFLNSNPIVYVDGDSSFSSLSINNNTLVRDTNNNGVTQIVYPRDNFTATTDPTTSNDQTQGYGYLSRWLNTTTGQVWVNVNPATGSSVWVRDSIVTASVLSGAIASGVISRFKMASGAINSGHIASGAVLGAAGGGARTVASGTLAHNDFGSGGILSGDIASGQIGFGHLANASVQSGTIASGQVGQFALSSGAVNSGQVGSGAVVGAVGAGRSVASGTIAHPDFGSGAIQSGDIASGQIGFGHLANASVQSGTIASGQVSRFALASGAANSGHVASGAVLGSLGGGAFTIASGTIGPNDLGSGAVTSGAIASGQVGQFAIASGAVTSGRLGVAGTPTGTNVLRDDFTWTAPGTPTITSGSIGSGAIASGAVQGFFGTTRQIASGTVGVFDLGSGAIVAGTVGSGAIVSGNISSGQVGAFHLSSGSVTSGAIASGQVGQNALSSGSVTSGVIASGSVHQFALGSGCVQSGQLNSGNVITFARNVFQDALVANEAISGLIAVALDSGGVSLVRAQPGSGLRMPAVGISVTNVVSGGLCPFITQGVLLVSASGAIAGSGFTGMRARAYVGSGGLLVSQSGYITGPSSGGGPGVAGTSGRIVQRVGVFISGGILVDVDGFLSSGLIAMPGGAPSF